MPDKVRVGVVGTGGWAELLHLPALVSHPAAEVAAICSRTAEHADAMARKYAIPQVFTDYRAMIEQGGLHAVVIVTPDDLHYPITMAALDAGLHVLCEKALALTADQAHAMYAKAEAAGLKHMILFTNRWIPPHRYLRQLIDAGYLGRCLQYQMVCVAEYGRRSGYAWRFDPAHGNGILADLGAHLIDLARWYVGEITRVSASLQTYGEHVGRDGSPLAATNDSAMLLLESANGAQGMIHVTAVAHVRGRGQDQQLRLYGEDGTLELDLVNGGLALHGARQVADQFEPLAVPDELWGDSDGSRSYIPRLNAYFTQAPVADRAFIDAIIGDRPVTPNFYDGFKVQQVIDAAIAAHVGRCWVELP